MSHYDSFEWYKYICIHVDGNFKYLLLFIKTHLEKELNALCNFKRPNNLKPSQSHLWKLYWQARIIFTGTSEKYLLFLEEYLVKKHNYNKEEKDNTPSQKANAYPQTWRIPLSALTPEHPAWATHPHGTNPQSLWHWIWSQPPYWWVSIF